MRFFRGRLRVWEARYLWVDVECMVFQAPLVNRTNQTLLKKKKAVQKIIADRAYKGKDGPCTEGG